MIERKGRFAKMFDVFEESLIVKGQSLLLSSIVDAHSMVFVYDHSEHKVVVYENVFDILGEDSLRLTGIQEIEIGKEIVYRDRVWFKYRISPAAKSGLELEAHIEYLGSCRPRICVNLNKPLLSVTFPFRPEIPGL
jgi:hypothetical protein